MCSAGMAIQWNWAYNHSWPCQQSNKKQSRPAHAQNQSPRSLLRSGKKQRNPVADSIYNKLLASPIQFLDTQSHPFFSEFAKIQIEYGTAFADTFVATTNLFHTNNKGTIVTSDPTFKRLHKNKKFHVEFFK